MKRILLSCLGALTLAVLAPWAAWAENEGLPDLDRATDLKLSAERIADLEKIVELCESAIKKGLNEENTRFAKQLAASTLYQRAEQITQAIFQAERPPAQWPLLREVAMKDLKKAVEFDDTLGDPYLLMAKLQLLPGGSRESALEMTGKAIERFTDDRRRASEALVLRAALQAGDEEKQLADLNRAIELSPDNQDARKARGVFYLQKGEHEKAAGDFDRLLADDADNAALHVAMAEALLGQEKYEQALQEIDKAAKLREDEPALNLLRARVYMLQEKTDEAMAQINKALDLDPRNESALLMRARMRHLLLDETEEAIADATRVLQLDPDNVEALQLRGGLAAAVNDLNTAIADLERLARLRSDAVDVQLGLASLYVADSRPRKAIELYDKVLKSDKGNARALRGRGDARLNIGEHQGAIADLEAALKEEPEDSGILNNLAWVLATSPEDKLRDGRRALELAQKAVELTEEKEAHILSTLAAAHAENGDFESAKKWSAKAVEAGEGEIKQQLQKELETYEQGKPFRERQETQEKETPKKPRQTFDL